MNKLNTHALFGPKGFGFGFACLLLGLVMAAPVMAQAPRNIPEFRAQYDAMLANYEQLFAAQGNTDGQRLAQQGRQAMHAVTDAQLAKVFAKTGIPDYSTVTSVSKYLLKPAVKPKTPGFPGPIPIISQCNTTDSSDVTIYNETIANNVAQALLSAAAFVCETTILGENGAAACIPLSIAASVTQGLLSVASFCSGLTHSAQTQQALNDLSHIHDDLAAALSGITTSINASTTSIVNNDNANKTMIVNTDNTNTASVIANDNANKTMIVNNDNANLASILANANANKNTVVTAIDVIGCENDRLENTPDGQRASSIAACSGQPGFPYKFAGPH